MKIYFVHANDQAILFEVEPASSLKPQWWKDSTFFKPGTASQTKVEAQLHLKSCPAIHSLFNAGYILRSPCDIEVISNNETFSIHYPHDIANNDHPLKNCFFHGHSGEQWGKFDSMVEDYVPMTFKFDTHIYVVSDEPCNVLYLNPFWSNFHRNLINMDAMLQTSYEIYDKLGHAIIPNFLVRKNTRTLIKQGDPLVHLIPFAQQSVSVESVHLFSQEEQQFFLRTVGQLYNKRLFSSHSLHSGFLKGLMFPNKYSLKEISPSSFFKKVKKSRNFPLFKRSK